MDRAELADFLRRRREALQPEDIGLVRGARRRTDGLRREEVAALCDMSADYYSRLERQKGPQPSAQMLAAIARGLRLSLDERDHLFRLAGQNAPPRSVHSDHVSPGLMRVLDRLEDTPAQITSALGETLVQTPVATALFGDHARYTGPAKSLVYRWFTDPEIRDRYPADDHDELSRVFTSQLRGAATLAGAGSRAAELAARLRARSAEFTAIWNDHEVGLKVAELKRIRHPEVGLLELNCQVLLDPDQSQVLLVYTATPGSESYEKLQLLAVIGASATV